MIAELMRMLAPLAEPLGFLWLVMCLMAIYLVLRRHWLGAMILAICAVAFSIIGASSLGEDLLASLERPYIRSNLNDLPACDAVVMLGGTHRVSAYDAFGFDLGNASDRIVTAIELMRLRKAKVLVLSGGTSMDGAKKFNPAVLLQKWFTAWNVPAGQVAFAPPCRTTQEEAMAVKEMAQQQKWNHILLVSSAAHLRRAEAVFKSTGLVVTAVGCDYQAVGIEKGIRFSGPVPRSACINQLEDYMHEELGWWLYRSHGWVGDSGGNNRSNTTNATGVGNEMPAKNANSN